ncbi:hypothetical protein RIF29_20947 [Crotalaria pallida]|uniref:Uncharacterized protein n=1 Tax=Crotalaria pallida TaxID=3830 RepID=A0AAN9I6S6_CROPI
MSTFFVSKFVILLLLVLLNPFGNNTRGCSTTLVCVNAARPLEQNVPKYMSLKPDVENKGNERREFQSGSVEACMPKGPRRTSAPSRYINYEPLGSTCSSAKVVNGP